MALPPGINEPGRKTLEHLVAEVRDNGSQGLVALQVLPLLAPPPGIAWARTRVPRNWPVPPGPPLFHQGVGH